jgi:tripartite-type tricarboxylate transporter receptor subunit TctC
VKELLALARSRPDQVAYGSGGNGTSTHLSGEMLAQMGRVKMVHVPYKGAAGVITAQLAGDVQIGFTTNFGVRPHVPSGRLRVLAMTAKKRSPALPDVPTVAESGVPGYEVDQWYGVITGARVPSAIVKKLAAGIAEAMKAPDVAQRLAADGSTPVGSTPERFGAHIKSEIAKWRKLVKEARIELHQ